MRGELLFNVDQPPMLLKSSDPRDSAWTSTFHVVGLTRHTFSAAVKHPHLQASRYQNRDKQLKAGGRKCLAFLFRCVGFDAYKKFVGIGSLRFRWSKRTCATALVPDKSTQKRGQSGIDCRTFKSSHTDTRDYLPTLFTRSLGRQPKVV